MVRHAVSIFLLLSILLLAPAVPTDAQSKDDDRAGTVTSVQGSACFRPAGRERWTPLHEGAALVPGDTVRTLLRGAHATEIRLGGGMRVTLGPGSLLAIREAGAVQLLRGEMAAIAGGVTTFTHVDDAGKLSVVGEPRWHRRYRETSTEEWMGSLVAKVDGRNVPLTIGTHQVRVTIRDQIAETVVTQSFHNRTDNVLEGEFTFPLPAGASVSGFGMWIGDELVMADIVERQRARQIYEDIRRRRKDPGLLEWSGGNLFKARVWPIPRNGAKRIRIRYTQVLPLRGSSFTYRYALRSEMTKKHPVEKLGIQVEVHSSRFLAGMECPSHPAEMTGTKHNASLRYDAVEARPDRDFEMTVRLSDPPPLSAVAHSRGDDGYLMLLMSPPGEEGGGWERNLTREGGPVDLVLLADTSASMNIDERRVQAEFIEALLAHLGPKDRFRLGACDVGVAWLAPETRTVSDESVAAALAFLDDRSSLGWSNLDAALKEALANATAGTQVIYLGDSVGTAGFNEPGALARRIDDLASKTAATAHAVSTGSSFDAGVMTAIARIGGGSTREAASDPGAAARDLISQLTRPLLRNATVSVEGLRTARLYPEKLPNLAAGTQQVLLGRFLPTGKTQKATIILSGTLAEEAVSWSTQISVGNWSEEQSFVPRLWASRHIDALLSEQPSRVRNEEIVARSREFGIITPLTSFLVLESDEDRERYGVTRTIQMRDGERFFTEAREKARSDARREAMRKGGVFRVAMTEQMRREIRDLGRSLPHEEYGYSNYASFGFDVASSAGREATISTRSSSHFFGTSGGSDGDGYYNVYNFRRSDGEQFPGIDINLVGDLPPQFSSVMLESQIGRYRSPQGEVAGLRLTNIIPPRRLLRPYSEEGEQLVGGGAYFGFAGEGAGDWEAWAFRDLFPGFDVDVEEHSVEPPADWPEEVRVLAPRLGRRDFVEKLTSALEIEVERTWLHPLRGTPTGHSSRSRSVITPESWFDRYQVDGFEPVERWYHGGRKGAFHAALRLGREGPAGMAEVRQARELGGLTRWELEWAYKEWQVRLEAEGGHRVLRLFPRDGSSDVTVLVIDPERDVVLRQETWRQGRKQASVRWEEFVKAGGFWWPTRVRRFDAEGRLTSREDYQIREIGADDARALIESAIVAQADGIFLPAKDPGLTDARQAVHDGKAGFADHFRILVNHMEAGRWKRAWRSFDAAASLAEGKPGLAWLRGQLLSISRRGEELKEHLAELADAATNAPPADRPHLAEKLTGFAGGHMSPEENLVVLLTLFRSLEPSAKDLWACQTISSWYEKSNRSADARRTWNAHLESHPADPGSIGRHLQFLVRLGDPNGAIAAGRQALAREDLWTKYEANQVYGVLTRLLYESRHFGEFFKVVNRWLLRLPENEDPYQRYLAGLQEVRPREADHWIGARLSEGLDDPDDKVQIARLRCAIGAALGHSWRHRSWQLDPLWRKPLADLARRLVMTGGAGLNPAATILGHDEFRKCDEGLEVRGELLEMLMKEQDPPLAVATLCHLPAWIDWSRATVREEEWQAAWQQILGRLDKSRDMNEERRIRQAMMGMLDSRGESRLVLDLSRRALAQEDPENVPAMARALLHRISMLPWSEGSAREVLRLLSRTAEPGYPPEWLPGLFAGSTRQAVQSLFLRRVAAILGTQEERDRLPRAELRRKTLAARTTARMELANLLAEEAKAAPAPLRPWMDLERLCFLAELGRPVSQEVERLLAVSAAWVEDFARTIFRERLVMVLTYAGLPQVEAPAKRILDLPGLEDDGERWRAWVLRLLLARGDIEAAERSLREWVVAKKVDSRWRVILGHLLTEKGRIEEAVSLLEQARNLGELKSGGFQTLADLYLVLGDEEREANVREGRWSEEPVGRVQDRLWSISERYNELDEAERSATLDEETIRMARTYLTRSGGANLAFQLDVLGYLYEPTKDHRILEPLADAVLGRSPQAIYMMLYAIRVELLERVFEEATLDAITRRILAVSPRARGPADRRALLYLEAMVERRAADVLNQPGPHAKAAREALAGAFGESWLPGEARRAAKFLADLGHVGDPAFRKEQLRQLRVLHARENEPSLDRLAIAHALYRTLWLKEESDERVEGLIAALDECRSAFGGRLPLQAQRVVANLIRWMEERGEFLRGETLLIAERGRQVERLQQDWYTRQLHRLYVHARQKDAEVSLGKGEVLYRAAREQMMTAVKEIGGGGLNRLLTDIIDLHKADTRGGGKERRGRFEDLIAFSRGEFLRLRERLGGSSRYSEVKTLGKAIAGLAGPRAALEFYIERLEAEPEGIVRQGAGLWKHVSNSMRRHTDKSPRLEELGPRLLAIILRELKADLFACRIRGRPFYSKQQRGFWGQKADEFAKAVMEVVAKNTDAPERLLFCAQYLWNGLGRKEQAIGVLEDALSGVGLRGDGSFQLATWRAHRREWKEAEKHLSTIVVAWPDVAEYRLWHGRALHHLDRQEESRRVLESAASHFRARARVDWSRGLIRKFADVSLECRHFELAAELYKEALTQLRKQRRRGNEPDREALPHCNGGLARALSGLSRHEAAVDAASAAVVAWGEDHDRRQAALNALEKVLGNIEPLDAWVAKWEAEVAESGLDAPVFRLALGHVYLGRKLPGKALPHFEAARRLSPDDPEPCRGLVDCHRRMKNGAEAREWTIALLHTDPKLHKVCDTLAGQFDRAGLKEEVERAWTSLAEFEPEEADGHRRLAKIREKQSRHAEAVEQWREVVRTRSFDPEGWLSLAEARWKAGDTVKAEETAREILSRSWGEEQDDVYRRARKILKR